MVDQIPRAEVPLARISHRALDELDDPSLVQAVIEPVVVVVRAKPPWIKSAVYGALSPGRRAVFAFWIVYGHARGQGWTRFFTEVPYLSAFPNFFGCLRSAFEYIGDEAMLTLVRDVEDVYRASHEPMEDLPAHPREPRYAAAIEALAPLDHRYRALVDKALGRVAARIRERSRDFVAFQDGGSHPT